MFTLSPINYMSNCPLVSVVIPCYNAESHILRAVSSVLSQDYLKIEVIVIDDGSTDESAKIVEGMPGVTLLRQENTGACAARNKGLQFAKGEFVKFLDADDWLVPGCIRRQVDCSLGLDERSVTYGGYMVRKGKKIKKMMAQNSHAASLEYLILNDLLTTTPLHRRALLDSVGGFDERFRNGQEWNLHIRLAASGVQFIHHPVEVFEYNIHTGESRISRTAQSIYQRINNDILKTQLTMDSIMGLPGYTENAAAAFAMRYWWIGRNALRAGEAQTAEEVFILSRKISNCYKKFWPTHYRLLYGLLGHGSEKLYSLYYHLRGERYV